MRRENFLKNVWLEEGERKMLIGAKCVHQKVLSKMERKLSGGSLIGK